MHLGDVLVARVASTSTGRSPMPCAARTRLNASALRATSSAMARGLVAARVSRFSFMTLVRTATGACPRAPMSAAETRTAPSSSLSAAAVSAVAQPPML
jgi:hypothetical protein